MTDGGNWWPLLLFCFMNKEQDQKPAIATETVYECRHCGKRYYGDPYYHPNFCDRCGGEMDEIVLTKEDTNDRSKRYSN